MARQSERTKRLIELRAQGLTIKQIAATLGISKNLAGASLTWLRKSGIIPRISKEEAVKRRCDSYGFAEKTKATEDKIIQLKREGQKVSQIAVTINQPYHYVCKVIRAAKSYLKKEYELTLIKMYEEGQIYERMSEHLHASLRDVCQTIQRLIKDGKIKKRKTKSERRMVADKVLIELYNSGKHHDEIAARLSLTAGTVRTNIGELIKDGQLIKRKESKRSVMIQPSVVSQPPIVPMSPLFVTWGCCPNPDLLLSAVLLVARPTAASLPFSLPLTEKHENAKKVALTLQIAIIQMLRNSYPQGLTREQIVRELELKDQNLLIKHSLDDAFYGAKLRKQIRLDGDVYKLYVSIRF